MALWIQCSAAALLILIVLSKRLPCSTASNAPARLSYVEVRSLGSVHQTCSSRRMRPALRVVRPLQRQIFPRAPQHEVRLRLAPRWTCEHAYMDLISRHSLLAWTSSCLVEALRHTRTPVFTLLHIRHQTFPSLV
ncbi:hypothetical protein DENSPDRAFT_846365 [Dentipellis sp. KUC8613]|nr:hypothetical protein DENSPDRAFT_846365 [Dentipellis sp. KUC8613]